MQHIQKMRNAYKTFAAKTEVKRPLRRARQREELY
jgi:hypothetical protein